LTRKFTILLLFTISFFVFADTEDTNSNNEQITPRRSRGTARNITPPNRFGMPTQIGEDVLSKEQQLIFGLVVINGRHNALGEAGFAHYLRELLSVTGYSAEEAKAIMEEFKNTPQKYLSVLEKIKQNLVAKHE